MGADGARVGSSWQRGGGKAGRGRRKVGLGGSHTQERERGKKQAGVAAVGLGARGSGS
jgi:hypothetical protein